MRWGGWLLCSSLLTTSCSSKDLIITSSSWEYIKQEVDNYINANQDLYNGLFNNFQIIYNPTQTWNPGLHGVVDNFKTKLFEKGKDRVVTATLTLDSGVQTDPYDYTADFGEGYEFSFDRYGDDGSYFYFVTNPACQSDGDPVWYNWDNQQSPVVTWGILGIWNKLKGLYIHYIGDEPINV